MCWFTTTKEFCQIRTTEEDIPVYKFLKRDGNTPYQTYPITFGVKLPKEVIDIDHFFSPPSVTHGYHSYSTSVRIINEFNKIHAFERTIGNGWLISFPHFVACYKAYIPKGTKYCINERNEIVSETLVVLDEIIKPDWGTNSDLKFVFDDNRKLVTREYHSMDNEKPVAICLKKHKKLTTDYSLIVSLLDEDWIPSNNRKENYFQKLYGGTTLAESPSSIGIASSIYLVREFVSGYIDWNMPYLFNQFGTVRCTGCTPSKPNDFLQYNIPMISIDINRNIE